MGRGRPRTAIGTFGAFSYVTAPNGKVKARVRFRDDDGQLRLVQATGDSRKAAERALKETISRRESYAAGYGEISADSSFAKLVDVWLADLDLENIRLRPRRCRRCRAEAYHHDLERLVPRIVSQHGLHDADDIAAVLRYRIEEAATLPPRECRSLVPRLIAGLIPEPRGPIDDEHRRAIRERMELIETRARALAEDAMQSHAVWARGLGTPPSTGQARERWIVAVSTVAAYRDRYQTTSDRPAGGRATSDAQRGDRRRALRAMRDAQALAATSDTETRRAGRIEISPVSRP